ncbi:MAG: hypothetical protein ACRERS_10145, partial [Methylococcales bacterium]
QNIRLQREIDRTQKSLTETITQKTRDLDKSMQMCEQQQQELANAKDQIARLEESARKTPMLQQKIEQQRTQIATLTETIENQITVDNSTVQCLEAMISKEEAGEPVAMEAAVDHLSMRFYLHVSSLHQQITDQSHLIEELQSRGKAQKGGAAQAIIPTSRLSDFAKMSFSKQVIEPISMRVNGLKKTVQSIPLQARGKIDELVIHPIHRRMNEIKEGMNQIPGQSSAQLNKIVVGPLNEFIELINRNVKDLSQTSQERFNHLVTEQLQRLIDRFKKLTLPQEPREYLHRIIIEPLEQIQKYSRQANTAMKQ